MKRIKIKKCKPAIYKIAAIAIPLLLCAFSCEKDKYEPDCKTGNCVMVSIKGSLLVKPSGAGLSNIPVDGVSSTPEIRQIVVER